MKNIKHGDKDDATKQVTDLQQQLLKLLFPIDIDGDFGNQTLTALNDFQKWNNITISNAVDDNVYNAIIAAVEVNNSIDKPSFDRIAKLHPLIRAEVLYLTKQCYKNNVKIRVVQGLRTFAEQDALYAQGRTKPGPIVTKAKGGFSNHNYGLSIDFCLLKADGSISWSQIDDADSDGKKDWMEVVAIFQAAGYEWGGLWKFKDNPHLEKTFGKSIRTLLGLHNAGKVDKNGYVII